MLSRGCKSIFILGIIGGLACKESEKTQNTLAIDAGTSLLSKLSADDPAFELALEETWFPIPVQSTINPKGSRTLAQARRKSKDTDVPPRLYVTDESAFSPELEASVRKSLESMLQFDKDVQVERRNLSIYSTRGVPIADFDFAYKISSNRENEKDDIHVVQRSKFMHVVNSRGELRLLTVTATFLAEDEGIVIPELERMLSTFKVSRKF